MDSQKGEYNTKQTICAFVFFGLPLVALFCGEVLFIRTFLCLFEVIGSVFLLESLDSASRIDVLLLTSVEWMANRANLCMYFFDGAAGFKGVTATAVNDYLAIFWMYVFFHYCLAPTT